jgi:hypothetical protein
VLVEVVMAAKNSDGESLAAMGLPVTKRLKKGGCSGGRAFERLGTLGDLE